MTHAAPPNQPPQHPVGSQPDTPIEQSEPAVPQQTGMYAPAQNWPAPQGQYGYPNQLPPTPQPGFYPGSQTPAGFYPPQGPPGGYYAPQPYPAEPPLKARSGLAITSLVLGIVGIIFGIIPFTFFIAWILGVIGLIFGLVAWRRRMGKAGSILNVVAIGLGVVGLVILVSAVKHVNEDFGNSAGANGTGYHVTLSPATNDSFETNVPAAIQNTSKKTCDFFVTVTANSSDGATQLASGTAAVRDVGPGQTASDDAGMLKIVPAGSQFKVGTVSRSCR